MKEKGLWLGRLVAFAIPRTVLRTVVVLHHILNICKAVQLPVLMLSVEGEPIGY